MKINNVPQFFKGYKIIKNKETIQIYKNGKYIIGAASNNSNSIIDYIQVSSPEFETIEGIKNGMRISELMKIYTDMSLTYDGGVDSELFMPDNYNSKLKILFKSDNGKALGNYSTNFKVKNFSRAGKIISIELYKDN